MKVKDLMTIGVEMVDSDASLVNAAAKMKSLDIGAMPVCIEDDIIGMITDRDITIRAIAEAMDPSNTTVNDIMTPEVFLCHENDDIAQAANIMETDSVRRLIVLNSYEEPVGFISLADFSVKGHDEHLTWEVLERISEPACPQR
ncbi:MAG: CBS domain-containing protein [Planctomycetes bacterium]|nr:CBS domain-containing protein [Planctomycetota bacterium]